jgi:hypothetical protein
MAYVERGGPPHFDAKGYHKWAARMMIFLRGKLLDFIVLDKTYAIPVNIHTLMVTNAGAKAKYEANAKAVDHLVRSLCDPEFERVRHLNLAWQIWEKLLVAHGGDNHVKARLFVSYRMQYENFTQLPGEDIDAMFQRFTAIVNNMKANVEDFPYTEHDQALKLLHVLDPNVWGAKVEAIKESGQYLTIELNDLFSKLKSAEVDRKLHPSMRARLTIVLLLWADQRANLTLSVDSFPCLLLCLFQMRSLMCWARRSWPCSQEGLIDYTRVGGMQGGA